MKWSGPILSLAVECLGQSRTREEAAERLSERLGRRISLDAMKQAFKAAGMAPTGQYLASRYAGAPPPDFDDDVTTPQRDTWPVAEPEPRAVPRSPIGDPGFAPRGASAAPPSYWQAQDAQPSRPGDLDKFRRLVELTKRGPIGFSDLCDRLDMAPSKARALVDEAMASGIRLAVAHDHIGIAPERFEERIQTVGIAPVVGARQTVGVISDLHFGSKYCLRDQIREFVHYAYHECGVREILGPGDNVDGIYKHGIWEVSHMGIDAQSDDMLDTLPELPGLNYRCITGNHDETCEDGNGLDFGAYIMGRARARGRNDIHYYGRRSAFLRVGGAVIHLWHPRGSAAYAKSYRLQKVIEKYSSGEKPHVLLVGHFHQYCHLFDRGVHAFLCPTFQGGGSAFGNSLGGAPAIGGMILSWDMTADGTMRRFAHEYRAYFEVERPHQVGDETAHREEMPIGR